MMRMICIIRSLVLAALVGISGGVFAASSSMVSTNLLLQPLSLRDVLDIALRQNPAILRAKKDLEAAHGVIIQTRAIAIPKVRGTGAYSAVQPTDIDRIETTNFTFGTDQNWNSQIRLVQSLNEGGRISSALRTARLTRDQAVLNYQTSVADTVVGVEVAYDDALLGEQQVVVQRASVELLRSVLEDTRKRYKAGTLPQFNVLRSEVELANAQPRLIRAQNDFRIAKNALANLLGFNLPREVLEDIPMRLADKLQAEPYDISLPHALNLALERRTELGSLRKTEALRKEDIITAQSGYKPSLHFYGGYDVHNSSLSDDLLTDRHGWITGVEMSWDIFDGFRTKGRTIEARALFERAGIDVDDAARRIELEVRTAFSNFREANELLTSQEKTVEWAEESLRLARARNEAGTATQLDVLSAQTALTEARTTQVQALHDYAVARARLQRAAGATIPAKPEMP